jgi:tRNA threonylcarbamoyladenosine biosynthesis protein TsaE
MQTFLIREKSELTEVAAELLHRAGRHRKFVLYGDLGAGKTALVQAICARLGVRETVASPTFSLVNEYSYFDGEAKRTALVHHIDLYRLRSMEEALDIGIEEYLYGPDYCFIEWPQLIESLLEEDTVQIKLELLPDGGRKIVFL